MIKLLSLLLLLIFPAALTAQFPLQRTYTATDGLAMTESAKVAVDPLGYVWAISTNNRISRFDGRTWKTYPPDGPNSLFFSYLYQLGNGDLLAFTGSTLEAQQLTLLRGDTLQPIEGLPETVTLLNYAEQNHLYVSADSNIYRIQTKDYRIDSIYPLVHPPGFGINGAFVIDNRLLLSCILNHRELPKYFWNGTSDPLDYLSTIGNGQLIRLYVNKSFFVQGDNPQGLSIYDQNFQFIRTIDYSSQLKPGGFLGQIHFVHGHYYIREIYPRPGYTTQPVNRIHRFDPAVPDKLEFFTEFIPSSANGNIWDIGADGSVWVAGHAGIQRYYPGTQFFPGSLPEMANSLHTVAELPSGDILFGGYGTGFARFNGNSLKRITEPPFDGTEPVMPASYRDKKGQVLFMIDGNNRKRGLVRLSPDGKPDLIPIPDPKDNAVSLTGYHFAEATLPASAPIFRGRKTTTHQDSIRQLVIALIGTQISPGGPNRGQFAFLDLPIAEKPVFRIVDGRKGIETTNVVCTAQDHSGRIWFAQASTGIGIYDPVRDTAVTWLVDRDSAIGAVSMVVDHHDRLWLGGRTGLFYIDSVSTIALQPSLHLRARQKKCLIRDIPDAYVAALLLDQDTLIVGHQAGVSLLNVNDPLPSPPALTVPTGDFLGMTEQNALLLDRQGKLWVGGDNGAVLLDQSSFRRGRRMQTKLTVAIAGGLGPLAPDAQGNFSLPLGDRTMTHSYFLPVTDQFSDAFSADVFLLSEKGDTLTSSQNLQSGEIVRTPHLYPGTYYVLTKVYANNQVVEDRRTKIWVPYQLTERWWFWAALVAALIGFLVFFQNSRIKRQKLISQLTLAQLDLSETRREKDRMQISTLAGTINPHFISNAIEWLQSAYLVKRPIEKMDEMAENLSDVIRMIFTKAFAETPNHSLKTELGLVERYFRTVNIQYDEAYDFRLPPQKDIDALGHHEVLLMQLQVHVENAVEHGLRYRNKANKVCIQLSQDDDYIYATVEDDGAGVDYVRKKQAEMNRRDGVGTSIMRKLQNTFNQYNQLLLDTTINSPTSIDKDGKPYGTRVTVIIPKHYSYALKSLGS